MSKEQKLPETPATTKIHILAPCHDKTDRSVKFAVGDEIELETERAEAAIAAGLAELATPGL